MSEILGRDIDGKPLRAGDLVVILQAVDPIYSDYIGRSVFVIGANWADGAVYLDVEARRGGRVRAFYDCVRKIDPKTDHEPADKEFTEWLRGVGQGQGISA